VIDRRNRPPRWFVRFCGALVALHGAAWLVLWLTGIAGRWSAVGHLTLKTNMALAMLLGGASLWLSGRPSPSKGRRWAAGLLAVIVLSIGGLTLVEHLFTLDLGIDQLLAQEAPGAVGTLSPNRIGPPGSASLFLLGAGLLALAYRRRKGAPYLGLAVLAVNLAPAVGFIYGIASFYSRPLTGVAWPTVAALSLMGFALAVARQETGPLAALMRDDPGGAQLRRLLPVVILVPLGFGVIHVLAERAGWLEPFVSTGLLVVSLIIVFSVVVWRNGLRLSRSAAAHAAAEEGLRESEERLARAQEMAHLGSWEMDHADTRVVWSDEVYRIFGLKPGEVRLAYTAFLAAVHPEDRAAVDAAFSDSIREDQDGFEYEFRIVRRTDGETRIVHTKSRNQRDASGRIVRSVGMVHDVTESRRAEALRLALAEQEKIKLGAAVAQASDSVIMFDLDGTIRYVNSAFDAMSRWPRGQAVGRSYFDLFPGHPSAGAIRQAIAQGRAWHGSLTRRISDGRPVDLEVTVSPAHDPAGTVIGGLATETDVTQRNALQEQVRQSQKMEALGTLAGGITHDFNNILGAIVLNTELALLDLDPSDPACRPLPLVLQAANRGKELIKQIITFSRQKALERKPVEIGPLIGEGMGLLRSTLPKDITVHDTIDPASGIVLADPSHIHQILVNLCQNAALAMQDGGGKLEVRIEPAEVDETMAVRHPDLKPGPYARLRVADTGCGMTVGIKDRIFEPFFTTREPGKGSGLGLAVVHGIVRSYGGAIIVASEPGKGSSFDVYIPRFEGEISAEGTAGADRSIGGDERILLVEDESAQRTSLADGLARLGYRVTPAADGVHALTAFRNDPGAFDLVITDQIMPRMPGIELASELAKIRPEVPIILCTGFSEKIDGGTVGIHGIRELIMKPFTMTELTRLIRKVVSPRSRS